MRYVSVMQLFPGFEAEYKKRHDELWPELAEHLTEFGIFNYYIYLEPTTLKLFATFEASTQFDATALAAHPVMKKWWDYMADIMQTGADSNAPVAQPLNEVFAFNPLPTQDGVCLVLDIGKTNVKLSAVREANGQTVATLRTENKVNHTTAYPSADTDTIWCWLTSQLSLLAMRFRVTGIAITTHGATMACMKGDELVLPVLDYEHTAIDQNRLDYDAIRPPFSETQSPALPAGLNLAAQLVWLEKHYPSEMAKAELFLLYPQYWAFRLSGIAASEVTSLGCHTDLWNPATDDFSSLVCLKGWREKFPTIMPTGAHLGTILPALAENLGLPKDCVIFNGIHDSNASLVPHLLKQEDKFAVVSTGTWTIIAGIGSPLTCLDQNKDMLANVNAFGIPTPSIRFMGGREWQVLAGKSIATKDTLKELLANPVYALPAFSDQGGPFRHFKGALVGAVDSLTEAKKTALASLYLALMTDYGLTQLQQDQNVIIEGAFAKNELLMTILATFRPTQLIHYSADSTGTTGGTAMLACREHIQSWPHELFLVQADSNLTDALTQYRLQWQSLIKRQCEK